jgi:hypothetical protein
MFKNIDPDKICDLEGAKIAIHLLLNVIEDFQSQLLSLREENQRLRDENNRLKGEQGRPDIKKSKDDKGKSSDISSEKERQKPSGWGKGSKNHEIKITRKKELTVDKTLLPADAEFKGYEDVIFQDIIIQPDNICFQREKFYSPSLRKSFLAPLPAGYSGQFGPGIKSYVIVQYYSCNVSEAKILEFLQHFGVKISAGEVDKLIHDYTGKFQKEREEILKEGLQSTPYQHYDDTGTRVNGKNRYCHILGNPFFTYYSTCPRKDRLTVIDVLMGGQKRTYLLDELAYTILEGFKIPVTVVRTLESEFSKLQFMPEKDFSARLTLLIPNLGSQQRTRILEAGAIAAYHAQTGFPIVLMLICDDAPQFKIVTSLLSLCWVHEGRHYKKLQPCLEIHRTALDGFIKKFWEYYDKLLSWQQNPDVLQRESLEMEFDKLFATKTGYDQLDDRIKMTQEKKINLLQVLDHPETPLNNNPAELAARARVRKRDVSFGPRSEEGVTAWDTFMTLTETAKKLGVSFFAYIFDRISGANKMVKLSDLIAAKAKEMHSNLVVNTS